MKVLFALGRSAAGRAFGRAGRRTPGSERQWRQGGGAGIVRAVRTRHRQQDRAAFRGECRRQKEDRSGRALLMSSCGNPPVIDALDQGRQAGRGSARRYRPLRPGRGGARGRAEARHFIGGGLQARAAGGESRGLSGQGRQRPLFRQSARPAGHQGGDARQAQADGGGRHRRSGRARGSRHGRGGGDAHLRRARRRSGRADPGGVADQDRFCRRLERLREGTDAAQGADPFSDRARGGADARANGVDPV